MSAEIYVSPEALADCHDVAPAVIVKYARAAAEQGGLTIGHWLATIEDHEIDDCLLRVAADREDEDTLLPWVLFAVMLANGEGLPVDEHYPVTELVRKLSWLLQVEMLRREGLIELDLATLSLDDVECCDAETSGGVPGPGTSLRLRGQHIAVRTLPLGHSRR